MERTKIEQLFENYSFWRHLSEEEKKMLQKQIRWCTYEEGQMVTDTGRDCLGIFLVCDGILPIWYRKPEKKLLYAGYIRENSV